MGLKGRNEPKMDFLEVEFKTKDGVEIIRVDYSKGHHVPGVGEAVVVQVVDCLDEWVNYEVTQVTTNIGRDCDAPMTGKVISFEVTLKPMDKKAKEEVKGLPVYWKNLFDNWEQGMNRPPLEITVMTDERRKRS